MFTSTICNGVKNKYIYTKTQQKTGETCALKTTTTNYKT